MEGDTIKVYFPPEEIARARGIFAAEQEHCDEIFNNLKLFMQRPDKDEIEERVAPYKEPEFESFVIPRPEKKKK